MHQPPIITHKERMGAGHSEIVHPLGAALNLDRFDQPNAAIHPAHSVADTQFSRGYPAFVCIEGVFGCGLNALAVDDQRHYHRVQMVECGGDGIGPRSTADFIEGCQYPIWLSTTVHYKPMTSHLLTGALLLIIRQVQYRD